MVSRAVRLKPESPGQSPWKPTEERARQREIKCEAVNLAAAQALRLRGYHNTSIDNLAALLNITKPTTHHYLQNKEEILFEFFRTGPEDCHGCERV